MATPASQVPPSAAQTIRLNAETAGEVGAGTDGGCGFCGRVGLAILPLRYAVVPKYLVDAPAPPNRSPGLNLPGPMVEPPIPFESGPLVDRLQASRLTLRTLRQGFVMVYLGSRHWQIYAVDTGGYLYMLPDPKRPIADADRELPADCRRNGHNVSASFIHIPHTSRNGKKHLPEKIWIAFSDTAWTAGVQKGFEGPEGAALRERRMQAFEVQQLARSADEVPHAFRLSTSPPGTQDEETGYPGGATRLHQLVFEYDNDHGRQTYVHVDGVRQEWEGSHGVAMRPKAATPTTNHGMRVAHELNSSFSAPAVVLFDTAGVAQEINDLRLRLVYGKMKYVADYRVARPLLISNAIDGVKDFVARQTAESLEQRELAEEWRQNVGQRVNPTIEIPGEGAIRDPSRVITLEDRVRQTGKPAWEVLRQEREQKRVNLGDTIYMEYPLENGGTFLDSSRYTTRAQRAATEAKHAWSDLTDHLRQNELNAFNDKTRARIAFWDRWIGWAASDYSEVFRDLRWQRIKTDYDIELQAEQEKLISTFNEIIKGGPLERKVGDVWKRLLELAPAHEDNPLYVAIFGNAPGFFEYITPDLPVPGDGVDDKVDKGHKLYKLLRGWLTFPLSNESLKEWRKYKLSEDPPKRKPHPWRTPLGALKNKLLLNPQKTRAWQESMRRMAVLSSPTVMGLGNALASEYIKEISQAARGSAVIAVQAAFKLYEGKEIFLLTTRMSVKDYLGVLQEFDKSKQFRSLGRHAAARPIVQSFPGGVRSFASGGISIGSPAVRDGSLDVTLWCTDDALAELASAPGAPAAPRGSAGPSGARRTPVAGEILRIHPFNLSPQAHALAEAVRLKYTSPATAARYLAQNAFRFATSGTAAMGVASFFFQGWAFWDNLNKANKSYLGNNEFRLLVVGSGLAAVSSLGEVVGQWQGLIQGMKSAGHVTTKLSWTVAGLAGLGEAAQTMLATLRTNDVGDEDAANYYAATSAAYAISSVMSAAGSYFGATIAVTSLFGGGLVLLAVGLILHTYALNAEDTPLGIWLDRCWWGKHSRYEHSRNPTERPWDLPETEAPLSGAGLQQLYANLDAEISELNALMIGMKAELGFNDDLSYYARLAGKHGGSMGSGIPTSVEAALEDGWEDTVKMKITLPFFLPDSSTYSWRLLLRDHDGGIVPVAAGRQGEIPGAGLPPAPRRASAHASFSFRHLTGPSKRIVKSGEHHHLEIELSAQVSWFFDELLLDVDYVNDPVADPKGISSLRMVVKD